MSLSLQAAHQDAILWSRVVPVYCIGVVPFSNIVSSLGGGAGATPSPAGWAGSMFSMGPARARLAGSLTRPKYLPDCRINLRRDSSQLYAGNFISYLSSGV